MRKKPSAFLIFVFVLGLLRGICAEPVKPAASTPVIVIEALGGNKADIPGWQPALGQGISEMLIESLENSDSKFQVLETAAVAGPQNESKPGASNSAAGETKPAGGGSPGPKPSARGGAASSDKTNTDDAASSEKSGTGVPADSDFTFIGDVTQFMMQTNGSKIGDFIPSSPFASLGANVSTAHVQIEWRIVDSETKKVIKRGITAASATGSGFDMAALTTTDGKAAMAGSATTLAKTATAGKSGTTNYADIFKGLILGNASSGVAAAGSSNGTTAKSTKVSSQAAPKTGGNTAGSSGGATASSAKTSSQTTPKAGGDVAGNGGEGAGETISYGNPAFMESALGKATAKAVTDIIKQLDAISLPEPGRVTKTKAAADALKHTAGKILAVAGKDTIIVSLGSKEGFKEGDTLEIYQPADVKDDKGNVVFTDEKLVGEITLQSVQDDKSRASYSGDAQLQQGWTVKAK